MSIEKVNEVPFLARKRQRGKLAQYWSIMGFIFQLIRDIDPRLKYAIDTFTLLGFIWTSKSFFGLSTTLIKGIYTHCWSRLWTLNLRKKYGQWVVITGATDGIGLEYARQFAERGHSLILVGRNASKLQKVKEELLTKMSPNQLVTILADFNDANSSLYDEVAQQIEPYKGDIGILINNAGVMLESPNRFLNQNENSLWQHIRVNIAGVVMMTRVVLPAMVARRKGLIINVSSVAAYKPLALMGVYSASKKFVEYFSETLKLEYGKSHNIDIQTLVPFYISTKMVNWSNFLKQGNIFIPDAKTFVNSAIATIGRADYTTGYWSHELEYFSFEWLTPAWLYSWFSRVFIRTIDSSGMRAKDL